MKKVKITIEKEFKNGQEARKWLKEKKMLPTDYERKSGKVKIKTIN